MSRELLITSARAAGKSLTRTGFLLPFVAVMGFFGWSIFHNVHEAPLRSFALLLSLATIFVGWIFIHDWRHQYRNIRQLREIEDQVRRHKSASVDAGGPKFPLGPVFSEQDVLQFIAGHRDWDRFLSEIRIIGEYTTA